jgi:hypothetical protein
MGDDVKEEIQKIIDTMRGFNNDPNIVDQRAKSLVITKLEEASMWFDKVEME